MYCDECVYDTRKMGPGFLRWDGGLASRTTAHE
jgi:hypothetical protein